MGIQCQASHCIAQVLSHTLDFFAEPSDVHGRGIKADANAILSQRAACGARDEIALPAVSTATLDVQIRHSDPKLSQDFCNFGQLSGPTDNVLSMIFSVPQNLGWPCKLEQDSQSAIASSMSAHGPLGGLP